MDSSPISGAVTFFSIAYTSLLQISFRHARSTLHSTNMFQNIFAVIEKTILPKGVGEAAASVHKCMKNGMNERTNEGLSQSAINWNYQNILHIIIIVIIIRRKENRLLTMF